MLSCNWCTPSERHTSVKQQQKSMMSRCKRQVMYCVEYILYFNHRFWHLLQEEVTLKYRYVGNTQSQLIDALQSRQQAQCSRCYTPTIILTEICSTETPSTCSTHTRMATHNLLPLDSPNVCVQARLSLGTNAHSFPDEEHLALICIH